MTPTQKHMNKPESIKQLKQAGFIKIKSMPDLFINTTGTVWNIATGKELHHNNSKQLISYENKRYSVPKLVLLAYKNEPLRKLQHISYIDGNNSNLNPENIKYTSKKESGLKTQINGPNLYQAIRCYFEVYPKYNIKNDVLTRFYIKSIITKRLFFETYKTSPDIDVFKIYIEQAKNLTETATQTGLNMYDVRVIVDKYINCLSSDILADMKAGILSTKERAKSKESKAQTLKRANEYINATRWNKHK